MILAVTLGVFCILAALYVYSVLDHLTKAIIQISQNQKSMSQTVILVKDYTIKAIEVNQETQTKLGQQLNTQTSAINTLYNGFQAVNEELKTQNKLQDFGKVIVKE